MCKYKNTLVESSLIIRKSKNYFSTLKNANPVLFRFCIFYGRGDVVIGYQKLFEYFDNLKNKISIIHSSFDCAHSFCIWLNKIGIYSTIGSSYSVNFIFNTTSVIKFPLIKKMKKILKEWEKYEQQKTI